MKKLFGFLAGAALLASSALALADAMGGMDMGGGSGMSAPTQGETPGAAPAPKADEPATPSHGTGCGMASCSGMGMAHGKANGEVRPRDQAVGESPFNMAAIFQGGGPKTGENILEFSVIDKTTNEKLKKLKIAAKVSMLSMDMGTDQPPVREILPGRYRVEVKFGMAGPWRVELRIATPGGEAATQDLDYDVKESDGGGNET